MMGSAVQWSILLSFCAWAVAPGYLVLRHVAPRQRPSTRLAMAPGISVALCSFLAYGADAAGLGVSVPSIAGGLGALIAVLRGAHRLRSGSWRLPAPTAERAWTLLALIGTAAAVVALTSPLRSVPVLPPTLHDGLDHTTWFRLVHDLERVDRYAIMAPPFGPDGAPRFYPFGFHAFAALVAHTSVAPPVVTFTHVVHWVTACIPLGVYAWVLRLDGRPFVAIAAACLSIGFYWLPFHVLGWGGFALMAGATCLPILARLGMDALERPTPTRLAVAVVVGLGTLLVHPSQALGALVVAFVGSLVASRRHRTKIVLGATLALPLLAMGLVDDAWPPLAAFLAKARAEAPALQQSELWRWPLGVYAPSRVTDPHVAGAVVAAAMLGALFALSHRRARRWLVLHGVLSLLIPLATQQLPPTALWYHAPERLWYLQLVALPGLGAVGLDALVDLARTHLRVPRTAGRATLIAATLLGAVPFVSWVQGRIDGWARSHEAFHDRRALEDFAWIDQNLPQDALLLNAPADHGLVTAMTGRRAVFWAGGVATRREGAWHDWLRALRRPSRFSPEIHRALLEAGVRYVYVADYQPNTAPPDAAPVERALLVGHPAFEVRHQSASGLVLALSEQSFRPEDVPYVDAPWARHRVPPLDRPVSVGFVGFHRVEQRVREDGTLELWRWAPRTSRIALDRFPVEAGCWLELLPEDFRPHVLRIDDRVVEPTDHPIPDERLGAIIEVEVRSDTFVAPNDPRTLGVQLNRVFLSCRPNGEPTRLSLLEGDVHPQLLAGERLLERSGLHGLERLPSGRTFRWTDGRADFRVDTRGLAGPCAIHVAYEGERRGEVWLDGQRVEPLPNRYALPGSVRPHTPFHLAFEATQPFVPGEVEGTDDDRELGIRVDELVIRCWD
jgi:hypothetical protein